MIALPPAPLFPLPGYGLVPSAPLVSFPGLRRGAASPPGVMAPGNGAAPQRGIEAAGQPEEDEDLGDEEDLAAQPLSDEESSFDDFDDEFDDDFEEEANDPDWDHPDDGDPGPPPPGKAPGRKK